MDPMSTTPLARKSTNAEIRARFDNDVERFTHLETGQSATIDAPLAMELITRAAVSATVDIGRVLDIGCGAGNNTVKLRQVYGRNFDVDLLDLSHPMMIKAEERVIRAGANKVQLWQNDLREADLPTASFDVILAAAVLHHLRDDADWQSAFTRIYRLLKPGGSVWITDLVSHEMPAVQAMMWHRYGEYLSELGGEDYREQVFAYIDKEDSPRPVTYQLALLKEVGFSQVELLHKNSCFAAFGAIK
ncbi:class I SAM-dependent methyltransferase [Allorhodopirellula heiligendammensis]|uniref:Demethylrebeccamycin-D-glucose O-methyltransferase n=1 Tax=Allorhodopirellula heiligendammensis TaxID=2714739 RepID=A0A5C6C7M6_9BACT|nr:class I SAM-dependent methyltransferase [Allorhodopirellula heiligendammensis]TWU20017.1 Demethylrebeccamycin-D-glucose O-methyltransferase [Allorhodopirellula heiligendammensis]